MTPAERGLRGAVNCCRPCCYTSSHAFFPILINKFQYIVMYFTAQILFFSRWLINRNWRQMSKWVETFNNWVETVINWRETVKNWVATVKNNKNCHRFFRNWWHAFHICPLIKSFSGVVLIINFTDLPLFQTVFRNCFRLFWHTVVVFQFFCGSLVLRHSFW